MANDLTRTPWIIDTASASPIKTGLTFVKGVTFSGYGIATDQAIIKDDRGRAILTITGNTTLQPVEAPQASHGVWIRDITVSTLSAGILTIWT